VLNSQVKYLLLKQFKIYFFIFIKTPTKHELIKNWILENIDVDELNKFDNNKTKCEYVISIVK
jgi:hypothetical protein